MKSMKTWLAALLLGSTLYAYAACYNWDTPGCPGGSSDCTSIWNSRIWTNGDTYPSPSCNNEDNDPDNYPYVGSYLGHYLYTYKTVGSEGWTSLSGVSGKYVYCQCVYEYFNTSTQSLGILECYGALNTNNSIPNTQSAGC